MVKVERFTQLMRRAINTQETAVLAALIIIVTFFVLSAPFFLSELSLRQNIRQIAMIGIIATGMTFVIASGEIDISVGSIYNLAATVMALLIADLGLNPWIAAGVTLLVAGLAGIFNGLLSTFLRLPTLIVTLGTVSLYRGIAILVSDGLSLGNLPDHSFYSLGTQGIGFVPMIGLIALAAIWAAAWVFRHTVFARELLAIGSNSEAAHRTGIQIRIRKIQVMALSGMFCGFAAILGMSFLRSASPQSGGGFELLAIAAVVVGGTPLQGGTGTIWGTLIGTILLIVIQSGLVQLGLPIAWQVSATGAMILFAVAIQQLVHHRRLN